MKRESLYFTAPRALEVRSEPLTPPGPGEAVVAAELSAISAGTEMLVYRGEFPSDIPVDGMIPAFSRRFSFPIKYGYALTGRVVRSGGGAASSWEGRRVVCLHPHESVFCCSVDDLIPVPDTVAADDAVFFPFMETAVALVMDARPGIGERAAVFGQGPIGLLTTALLARFPLRALITVDPRPLRRERSRLLGATTSLDPSEPDLEAVIAGCGGAEDGDGLDLAVELSGNPAGLDRAFTVTGYDGRIMVGSWYGTKTAALHLGTHFHRRRHRVFSSQVSTLAPGHRGRWTRSRRTALVWEMIRRVGPSSLITHRASLRDAPELYALIDREPERLLQAVFEYRGPEE